MIDIHHHLLPGVDDGARDMEETLEMARCAVADGITTVVCTPHAWKGPLDVPPETRDTVLAKVKLQLTEADIQLNLLPGSECTLCPEFIQRIKDEPRYLMGNAHTVLIEWPDDKPLNDLEYILFEAQLAEIEVVLAHAERIDDVRNDPSSLEMFVDRGLHVQIQASSLTAALSWRMKRTVTTLLRSGWVHVIATDAHNCRGRRPMMAKALDKAKGLIGPKANDLVLTNPARLVGIKSKA